MKKNVIKLNEAQLRRIVAESAKKVLREGYQMTRNEYGEPIGQEYIPDQYEQEISDAEEMDRKASDPMYAASQERQEWLRKARAAFEEQGIEVPEDVVRRLAEEMAKKADSDEKEYEFGRAKRIADFINQGNFGVRAQAEYDPPTPEEYGHAYVTCSPRASKEQTNQIIQSATENGLDYIEDYLDYGF